MTWKKGLALVLLLCIPALLPLTKQGFFPTHDFIHVARIYEMDQALKDGQFPVRWVADFRYGEPLFNFYAPLPYYLGSLIHNLSFSFLDTTKILLGAGFILSAIAMFALGRQLFGITGAVLAAVLYTYAPYHSVDVYVRGALSESLALIFFPLIFLSILRLSEKTNIGNIIFLSLSLAGLFLTHNIMTILFSPFILGWVLYLWVKKRSINYRGLIFAALLGFGLAAYFLLPAFFEKSLVQSDKMITGYFDYKGHFVAVKQFFVPFWGYGASLWGSKDDLSLQIGLVHWVSFLISLSLLVLAWIKKERKIVWLTGFLTLEFIFSLFMQHNKSTPLWLTFPLLAYTQFPWRFLGISIFFISLTAGVTGLYLKGWKASLVLVLVIAAIAVNTSYFQPESYYADSKDDHYVGPEVLSRDDKLPKDYLPIWVSKIEDKKISSPQAVEGKAEISNFIKSSTKASFNIKGALEAKIVVPLTFFPGWRVYINGKEADYSYNDLGLIEFSAPSGEQAVRMVFTDTPIRMAGNIISLFSLLIILALIVHTRMVRKNTL